jgi:hypothetical protein
VRVHRSHPQVYDRLIMQTVVVFDCAQCGETFYIRSAYVQGDGSLRCFRCSEHGRGVIEYCWCPQCRKTKPFNEFEPRAASAERHRWCLECVAAMKEAESLTRACDQCGSEFTPTRRDARFCSGRCRVAAHRAVR